MLVDREMIKYIRSTILADGLVGRLAPGVDLAALLRRTVEDYLASEARDKIFSKAARSIVAGGPDHLDAIRTQRYFARAQSV